MNNLVRLSDESIKDFKIRLCKNRELYNLTWDELAEIINKETGDKFGESKYRKWWYAYSEGLNDAIDNNITEDKFLIELDLKRRELEKEKQRFFDQRSAYNKIVREDARRDELKDIITNTIRFIEPYKNSNVVKTDYLPNDLLVGLNDLHFGIEIENYWNKYNSEIAKQRLEKYLAEIISVQQLHKSENCYVCANGDLISGSIHYTIALANRENVVEQVMGVSELISWFLSQLSNHFNNVYFSVVAGNHSRLTVNKDMSPKNERLDDLIPFYVKARLQNLKNISIIEDKVDNTMSLVEIRGLNYLGVHGDMDTVNGILKLIEMLPQKIYAIVFGHLHHNATNYVQGYKTLMSGSLMGVDDYCIEKRIFGKPQQLICVCDKDGVKCSYDVIFQ
jgi:hypothetical protein